MKKNLNKTMLKAKKAKNDDFYTLREPIERELKNYKQHFEGKTVFLNCDDPRESQFFVYFTLKFEDLKLKKLIATGYKENTHGVKYIYEGNGTGDAMPNYDRLKITQLEGNGGFETPECVELLKESDIIVSNPPFSRWRDYVNLLMEYNKKFIIIGNNNAIAYKEIFSYMKENKIWLGTISNVTMEFGLHPEYESYDEITTQDGRKIGKVPAISWFTNLEHKKRNDEQFLYRTYYGNEDKYPKYENYDAININKVKDIPEDYFGVMGVPITFMSVYNPNQFEILGMCENKDLYSLKTKVYSSEECKQAYLDKFGKKGVYDLNASGVLRINGLLEKMYHRILIKRK